MIWYLKQLLPLKYESLYRDSDGRHYSEWRMWFGKVFKHVDHAMQGGN